MVNISHKAQEAITHRHHLLRMILTAVVEDAVQAGYKIDVFTGEWYTLIDCTDLERILLEAMSASWPNFCIHKPVDDVAVVSFRLDGPIEQLSTTTVMGAVGRLQQEQFCWQRSCQRNSQKKTFRRQLKDTCYSYRSILYYI